MKLIEGFRDALDSRQFRVYYQPILDVRGDEPIIAGAEALVRWEHPEHGSLYPREFLPALFESGQITELDRYVWSTAAEEIRRIKVLFGAEIPISVNVSLQDLKRADTAETLCDITSLNGIENNELLLEINESAYTDGSSEIIENIRKLKELGFRFMLDDFGSGLSPLGMLSSLPVDTVKLDVEAINKAFSGNRDLRIPESIIRLSELFEIKTVAEGVETDEQLFTLKMMGCEMIQGYCFSRPVPQEEFEAFIKSKYRPEGNGSILKREDRGRITYNALHDPQTGLYNRTAFEILFRDADQEHIAILAWEIADFEEIKKTRGRTYANSLVLRVAKVLKSCFRSVDHICRLKENEIVVILSRVKSTHRDMVISKIESIRNSLTDVGDGASPIELNVGVAFSLRDQPEGDVLEDAETALMRLKLAGKKGYKIY